MNIRESVGAVERDDVSHRARILILLQACKDAPIEGALDLVRLVYLDYFLRYPSSLEKLLTARGKSVRRLKIEDFERDSLSARFGALRVQPWDLNYRRWLAAEYAAGRIEARLVDADVFSITLTPKGVTAAASLRLSELFEVDYTRATMIARHLDLRTVTLAKVINQTLPETTTLEPPVRTKASA
ncbi:MAG: hypothetical protein WCE44_03965 [Candidatus Velthaea sp.]